MEGVKGLNCEPHFWKQMMASANEAVPNILSYARELAKRLGVAIDKKLSLKSHVDNPFKQARSYMHMH